MLFEFNTNMYEKDTYEKDMYTKEAPETFDLEEGFVKGNMFKNLYDEYKDYKPYTIKVKTERESMLVKLMMLDFAINDLNLYLEIYPDDKECYQLFTKYCLAYEKLLHEYEKKYQVLDVNHDTFGKYTWFKNPWPWEGNYV